MATKGQIRVKNVWRCEQHGDHNVSLCCVTCGDVLICTRCVTSIHAKHDYCQFEDVLTRKKKTLESLLQKYEEEIIPNSEKQLKNNLDKQKINKESTIQIVQSIVKRGEEMKEQIDKYTAELIGMCKRIQIMKEKALQKMKDNIVEQQRTAFADRNNLKQTLERLILPEMVDATKKTYLSSTSFKTDDEDFDTCFISRPKGEGMQTLRDLYGTLQPLHGEFSRLYTDDFDLHELLRRIDEERNRRNIDDTISLLADEQNKLEFSLSYDCLVPRGSGMILAERKSKESILLLSAGGKLEKKVFPKKRFLGFAFCTMFGIMALQDGAVLQINYEGEMIKSLASTWYPFDMATFSEGQIIVGQYDGVAFSVSHLEVTSGKSLRDYKVMGYPQRVCVNKMSGDVAIVCDYQIILILDRNLTARFWYCGLMDSTPGKPGDLTQNRMRSLFKPVSVCFDSHGRILIADQITKSIMALNKNGKFLKVIVGFQNAPVALAVDRQDRLWASLDDNTVRIIKYTK